MTSVTRSPSIAATRAGDEIGDADEAGDEGVGRLRDRRRPGGAFCWMRAVVHHDDLVGHDERLALVVGDVDRGDAELALDAAELELHLLAQLAVERGERLVEQQEVRLEHQRPGDRHALLLAAGELVDAPVARAR